MSQPKLDRILIDVANAIGDSVATAGASGKTYIGADRLTAINTARKAVYDAYIEALGGIDNFIATFPEWVMVLSGMSLATVPAYVKKVIKMYYLNGGTKVLINPVNEAAYLDALHNTDSSWAATSTEWYFLETATVAGVKIVQLIGTAGPSSVTTAVVIGQPVDALHDTISGGSNDDIPDPVIWSQRITDMAVKILLSEQQIRN